MSTVAAEEMPRAPSPSPGLLRSSTAIWKEHLDTARDALAESQRERLSHIAGVKKELQSITDEIRQSDVKMSETFQSLNELLESERQRLKEVSSKLLPKKKSKKGAADAAEESSSWEPSVELDVSKMAAEFEMVEPPEMAKFKAPTQPPHRKEITCEPFSRTDLPDTSAMSPKSVSKLHSRLLTCDELLGGGDLSMIFSDDEKDASGSPRRRGDMSLDSELLSVVEETDTDGPELDEDLDARDVEDELLSEEQRALLAEETPEKLMTIKTAEIPTDVQAIVGNPVAMKKAMPKKGRKKKVLDRELRKMKLALMYAPAEERKWTKLVVLKHLDVLQETYKRYCKIGGDLDWLTATGWTSMCADACVPSKALNSAQCDVFFTETFAGFHGDDTGSMRSKRKAAKARTDTLAFGGYLSAVAAAAWEDDDPWSGHWGTSLERTEEVYHLKQLGDRKLFGFIKNRDFCCIDGALGSIDHTKAKLVVTWNEGPRVGQIRIMTCHLKPPETPDGDTIMDVEWHALSTEISPTTAGDKIVLYKVEPAADEEFVYTPGLARHEFFDAVLRMSKAKFPHLRVFEAFDKVLEEHIIGYIWGTRQKAEAARKKQLFRKFFTQIRRLYADYAAMAGVSAVDNLSREEWTLFARDVLSLGKREFAKGGKPTDMQIDACFSLALPQFCEELAYPKFALALEYLADSMFKKKPKTKYIAHKSDEKLSMLVQWCVKLDRSKEKADAAKFKRMKSR